MFVHAHPDDESSQSPATMSRYVDEGARVTLVTCTLGELGEILVPEWEHYTPEELGAKRVDELAKALKIVGVTDHVWLGGKGRYHDSGMATDDEGRAIPRDELPDGRTTRVEISLSEERGGVAIHVEESGLSSVSDDEDVVRQAWEDEAGMWDQVLTAAKEYLES